MSDDLPCLSDQIQQNKLQRGLDFITKTSETIVWGSDYNKLILRTMRGNVCVYGKGIICMFMFVNEKQSEEKR